MSITPFQAKALYVIAGITIGLLSRVFDVGESWGAQKADRAVLGVRVHNLEDGHRDTQERLRGVESAVGNTNIRLDNMYDILIDFRGEFREFKMQQDRLRQP